MSSEVDKAGEGAIQSEEGKEAEGGQFSELSIEPKKEASDSKESYTYYDSEELI